MRQASCGCCCSLKFFAVLATAYWKLKYRWSCLPYSPGAFFFFVVTRTHACTHSDLCMRDGLFSSVIFFYFGASGSWLSEMHQFQAPSRFLNVPL